MKAITQLKQFQRELNPLLKEYLKEKLISAKENSAFETQAVRSIKKFVLSGGKRVRPALVYYSFLLSGGKEKERTKINHASMSVEFAHAFLLIHDDIIDRDKKRHGIKTIHEEYRIKAKLIKSKINHQHFGNSMALIIGDMAYMMGNETLLTCGFSPQKIVEALKQLKKIVHQTVPGEMADVYFEAKGKATEKEIIQMQEAKTARYTFEGPLHLGAILAGASKKQLDNLSAYALPLGVAFQLRDDILGLFADEKKLGKPVGSDIQEGKQTLLVVKALEKGNAQERKVIKQLLGKQNITGKEVVQFCSAIKTSGSLEYSIKLSEKLVKEALLSLENIKGKNKEALEFLRGLAEYIINRNK